MKRKLLALLLVFTMLGVSVFAGISTSAAADENLLSHLKFTKTSELASSWNFSLHEPTNTYYSELKVKNDTVNSESMPVMSLAVIKAHDRNVHFFDNKGSAALQKNRKYTMSFWVKVNNLNLTVAMYTKTSATSGQKYEGNNPYSSDSIRSDVNNKWYVNGQLMAEGNSSVLTFSSSSLGEAENTWVQVVHTFETGGSSAHEAYASYHIAFPANTSDNTTYLGFSNLNMVTEEVAGAVTYTPTVNDEKLGLVSKDVVLVEGRSSEITAEPFGDNVFQGWYVGEEEVSTDLTYSFTYDSTNPPAYEARFTAGPSVIDGHYENATAGTVAKHSTSVGAANWTDGSFLASTKDNIHYVDDAEGGLNWRNASVSTDKAHTGSKSLKLFGSNAAAGRKITGLNPNSKYVASVYAFIEYTGTGTNPKLNKAIVTNTDKSMFKKPGSSPVAKEASDDGVLGYTNIVSLDANGKWQKIEVEFITGNFTEVILWTYVSNGTNNMVYLYLDNYALKQVPLTFKAQSNVTAFGTVTPTEEMEVNAGQQITALATPTTIYNEFEGWYAGDTLVSESAKFTFSYIPDYAVLTAKFKSYGGELENHSMEEYTDGQELATFEAISADNVVSTSTAPWRLDSIYKSDANGLDTGYNKNILKVTTAKAHTGDKSVVHNIPYRYIGYDLKNLKTNTDYVFSFFAYITGKDDGYAKQVNKLYAVPTSKNLFAKDLNGKYKVNETVALAKASDSVECFNKWEKAEIEFNTKGNTEVTIWISYEGAGANLYIDDLCIYEPVKASFSAGLGGEVKANIESGNIAPGTNVTLTATALEGNTFIGWFDTTGKILSTNAVYNFIATENFNYNAKFEGSNKPAVDVFASQGLDGTFESYNKGTKVSDWSAAHTFDSSVWCTFEVSDTMAYEGTKSLEVNARMRSSKFVIDGLSPNTDYKLSFYVNAPDSDSAFSLNNFFICDAAATLVDDITTIFASADKIEGGSGWNRVDLHFSTGLNTEVALMFSYTSNEISSPESCVYFDNFCLYAYDAKDEVVNGDADGTGEIDMEDVAVLSRYLAGWEVDCNESALDVSGDGAVNLFDLVLLSQFVAGWDVKIY